MNRFLPVDDQKPSAVRNFVFSLIVVFIMIAALPVGVYLVGQNTNFLPEAATPQSQPVTQGSTGFSFDLKQDSKSGAVIGVNILIKSEVHEANLFTAKINFPSELLKVESVATSSASVNPDKDQINAKWVSVQFNNDDGSINLVGGMPNPGLKTDPNKKYVLATIYFKSKQKAEAKLSFDLNSKMYQNTDNSILPSKKTDVLMKLPDPGVVETASPSCVPYPACFDDKIPCALPEPSGGWCRTPAKIASTKAPVASLQMVTPNGGESLSYNDDQTIEWRSSGLNFVTIAILMNDQILGNIASVSAGLQKFNWQPKNFISPTFITPNNSFKIALSGVGDKTADLHAQSEGPFAISNGGVSAQSDVASQVNDDLNSDSKIDFSDLSVMFSSFGINPKNMSADLNGDRVVNEIDLWLFKKVFPVQN